MKIKLSFPAQDYAYTILIGLDLFSKICTDINKNYSSKKIVIFCDSNVKKIYADRFISDDKIREKSRIISFPAGEKYKSTMMKEKIETLMLKGCFDRNSVLVALGGGVTGDLGGFISATYYRGIPFIQVPTTLLAMVDSSIGGKVAVNHPLAKNMIGSFYQPKAVYIDINTLKTLPEQQYLNGISEIVKTALIHNETFFYFLEKNYSKILDRAPAILKKMIYRSCLIKSKVVMQDEKEFGIRKTLNYGHTIGHAVEILSKFKIPHGFSVSIGMHLENIIAFNLGFLKFDELMRIKTVLKKFGLPTKIPNYISSVDIVDKLKYDKKSINRVPRFALLKSIGDSMFDIKIHEKEILKALSSSLI